MRRLLVVLAAVSLAFDSGLLRSNSAEAAVVPVAAYLYHPAGNSSYSAILTCGWHDVCDGVLTDTYKKGLDWRYQSNASYTVWVRINAGDGSVTDMVATGAATNSTSGCKRIVYNMYRYSNGQHIGSVTNQHSKATSTVYMNLTASASGHQNAGVVGTMLLTSEDNCTTTGRHTMQWYSNGAAGSCACKNSAIPSESGCNGCNGSYGIWATHEYSFGFSS